MDILDFFSGMQFDLIGVLVAVTGIGVLAGIVFFRSKSSITSRSFFFFSFITIFWGLSNYFLYKFTDQNLIVLALRIHIFLTIWHSYSFFQLAYVFPDEKKDLPIWHRYVLLPVAFFTSALLLIPFVFTKVSHLVSLSEITDPTKSDGIILGGILTFSFLISGLDVLYRKIDLSKGDQRRQLILMFTGMSLTAGLLLLFSFVLPIGFHNYDFVPFGALFIFPVIVFTAYAIYIVELFHVKNIFAGIFTFFLCVFSLVELIISDNIEQLLLRILVFILTLVLSIQLVRNTFEIELANEQKSELMTFATHEIRTPITVMRGYASILLDGDKGPITPPVVDLLQKIMISGNEVISLLSQYLNKSKIELGQLQYVFLKVDVVQLVNEVLGTFQVNAQQKNLYLTEVLPTREKIFINADQGKLKEVIINLIDNSIKYTQKGSVSVSVEKHNTKVIIKVSDTGVGIEEDTMKILFREFSRADIQKVNILGTGLGLYLAKIFVTAHSGRIWAESEGKGNGAQFYIELPEA
ncbi:MAG: HAMP domain-containing histidine kinase [Candidatus Pacebacteria bacterium]|nr:HAMP domain-containing histidine kinase [Candidatus Paceibacterota bacterium]MBP9866537.1 HAMP domain-containing histidine kinase [Candidatus Paceibacterota bacterium]